MNANKPASPPSLKSDLARVDAHVVKAEEYDELPEFKDDPKTSNEKKLEAIQMAWYEEYQDAQS